jgi:hypothetical protein
LVETAKAHHEATGGTNEDWAIWYAEYMFDRLPAILEQPLSMSELIYCLMLLSKKQPVEAPDVKWPTYYAEYMVEQYG